MDVFILITCSFNLSKSSSSIIDLSLLIEVKVCRLASVIFPGLSGSSSAIFNSLLSELLGFKESALRYALEIDPLVDFLKAFEKSLIFDLIELESGDNALFSLRLLLVQLGAVDVLVLELNPELTENKELTSKSASLDSLVELDIVSKAVVSITPMIFIKLPSEGIVGSMLVFRLKLLDFIGLPVQIMLTSESTSESTSEFKMRETMSSSTISSVMLALLTSTEFSLDVVKPAEWLLPDNLRSEILDERILDSADNDLLLFIVVLIGWMA